MVVAQGDVFWADFGVPHGSEPGGRRPVLVVQSDLFNRSRLNTVVVAILTTNLRLRDLPGNVGIRKGEANLPRTCTVNVTQLATLDRSRLVEKIGSLSAERVASVLEGLDLLLRGV